MITSRVIALSASIREGLDDGKTGFSYYRNEFYGKRSQTGGQLGARFGRTSIRVDEDWVGDGQDRYRTGGMQISRQLKGGGELFAGFRIKTGEISNENDEGELDPRARHGQLQYTGEKQFQREGLVYGGYSNSRGINIAGGIDSEKARYFIQNGLHDCLNVIRKGIRSFFGQSNEKFKGDLHFKYAPYPSKGYFSYGNYNPFTLY